jgi:hypothetical protein
MTSKKDTDFLYGPDGKLLLKRVDFNSIPDGKKFILEWDCPVCKREGIWGDWLSCPDCKTQQPKDSASIVSPCWLIVDEDYEKQFLDGAFWRCTKKLNKTVCGQNNTNSDIACLTCGGDRDIFAEYFSATLENSIRTGSSLRSKQANEIVEAIQEGVRTSVFEDDNVPFDPNLLNRLVGPISSRKFTAFRPFLKWIVGVFATLLFGIGFWYQFIQAVPATGKVVGYEWSRTINIEQLVLVPHESSTVPLKALDTLSFQKIVNQHEVPTGKKVIKGTKPIEDLTKTISFDCSQTTGNGAAQKKTCTKHPIISVPNEVDETKTVYEYETRYRYNLKEWQFARDIKASGNDLKPYWPAFTLSKNPPERESVPTERYTVFFKNTKTGAKQPTYLQEEQAWKKYRKGQKYAYDTNRAGMMTSKPQALLRGNW